MSSKSVTLKGVSKTFEDEQQNVVYAVSNVDLAIQPGEFVTLLGPSGCGKTTLLRIIAGFEDATAGDVLLGDENVSQVPPNKRDCAMVFQSYALFPHLNVFDNVAYGLKLKRRTKAEINARVDQVLHRMGLAEYRYRMPGQLSGGQQQRVALARAIIMEPSVLLFDEPLSNLDAKLRISMRDEIRRIQQEVGITAVYVTHDQSEALSMSDRIVVMNQGQIEQIGTPQQVYQQPRTKFVADFIGRANFIEGEIVQRTDTHLEVKTALNIMRTKFIEGFHPGDKVAIVIRPESIVVSEGSDNRATVFKSVYMGQQQEYEVNYWGNMLQITVPSVAGQRVFHKNEQVSLHFPEDALHLVKL